MNAGEAIHIIVGLAINHRFVDAQAGRMAARALTVLTGEKWSLLTSTEYVGWCCFRRIRFDYYVHRNGRPQL